MIEQFASACDAVPSELLDLNRTSSVLLLVPLQIPKFAPATSSEVRRTSELGH
jgi:hypothetical protein